MRFPNRGTSDAEAAAKYSIYHYKNRNEEIANISKLEIACSRTAKREEKRHYLF